MTNTNAARAADETKRTPESLLTPLRWQEDYAYAFILDADDRTVAFLGDTKAAEQPFDWHAVAAEIVNAVNAHAGLLVAAKLALRLRALENAILTNDAADNAERQAWRDEAREIEAKIRAAIANAERKL
jgi:hypothetical protein